MLFVSLLEIEKMVQSPVFYVFLLDFFSFFLFWLKKENSPRTTKTTIRVTRFFPLRDSAETLLPGTVCQRRANIPM